MALAFTQPQTTIWWKFLLYMYIRTHVPLLALSKYHVASCSGDGPDSTDFEYDGASPLMAY